MPGNRDYVDEDVSQMHDVIGGELPDWADGHAHMRGADLDAVNACSATLQLQDWLAWGTRRDQRLIDRAIKTYLGMARSRWLPMWLAGTEGSRMPSAQSARVPMGIDRQDPPSFWAVSSEATGDASSTPVDAWASSLKRSHSRIPASQRPLNHARHAALESGQELEPTTHRLYRILRVWLSPTSEMELASSIPARRQRRHRGSAMPERTLYAISEESNEKEEHEMTMDDYLTSLDNMLDSLKEDSVDEWHYGRREAIRAKLQQSLEKLDRAPSYQRDEVFVISPSMSLFSQEIIIPVLISAIVVLMRIVLILTAFSLRLLGVPQETTERPTPFVNRDQPPEHPPPTPNERGFHERSTLSLGMMVSQLAFFQDPTEALRRHVQRALLDVPRAPMLAPPSGRPVTCSENPLSSTMQALARAVKQSPLPHQFQLLSQRGWALARHLERRTGLWHNFSHTVLQCITSLICYIKMHDLHVRSVRLLLSILESIVAALRTYQETPAVV